MDYELISGFLYTPPLWQGTHFGVKQFEFPNIDMATFVPQTIRQNIRLGHQMEAVFHQLLEASTSYRILLYNHAVKNHERTIGEIDFILQHTVTKKFVHVELTYKFYLIDSGIPEPVHQLLGPNKNDMFFTKLEKIKNVQFPLLYSEEGKLVLTAHGITERELRQQVCFKAQLFKPYGSNTVQIGPLNSACIAGAWVRFEDFKNKEFQKQTYYIPLKKEWANRANDVAEWASHNETLIEINSRMLKHRSPLIWMRHSASQIEKLFVVWW